MLHALSCSFNKQRLLSSCSFHALEHWLSSWGTQAGLPHSMWDLPNPGIESTSPALAGRFFTPEPLEKLPSVILGGKENLAGSLTRDGYVAAAGGHGLSSSSGLCCLPGKDTCPHPERHPLGCGIPALSPVPCLPALSSHLNTWWRVRREWLCRISSCATQGGVSTSHRQVFKLHRRSPALQTHLPG